MKGVHKNSPRIKNELFDLYMDILEKIVVVSNLPFV